MFRGGRDHAAARPGSFAPRLASVEQSNAQADFGELKGDRSADDAASGDDGVVGFHGRHFNTGAAASV